MCLLKLAPHLFYCYCFYRNLFHSHQNLIDQGRRCFGHAPHYAFGIYNCTGEQYTDATNAEFASNAISGVIPAFMVVDASLGYKSDRFSVTGNVNNLLDNDYFTKRAVGYPGPGIIPAPPRMFYITLGLTL